MMSATGVHAVAADAFAVETHKLTKRYGDLLAVDELDLTIRIGECFGLLGPNGAGKSSTLRMIYGRTSISSGRLFVLGKPAGVGEEWQRNQVGVVSQEDSLDPDLTVWENLFVTARYYGFSVLEARERADELLAFAQLEEKKEERVEALSGGMKRRLMVARGLVNRPRLLILDEPSTGLDPRARRMVWDQLEQLKREGVTLLLTTHYMDEAARLCDRLALMNAGHILAEGKPDEVVRTLVGTSALELQVERSFSTLDTDSLRHELKKRGLSLVREERAGDVHLLYFADAAEKLERQMSEAVDDVTGSAKFSEASPARGKVHYSVRLTSLEDAFLVLTGRGLEEV